MFPRGAAPPEPPRRPPPDRAGWLGQRSRALLPNDQPAHRGRNDGFDAVIGKKARQSVAELFRKPRILKHLSALDVHRAVQSAGKLKVPLADGARRLKKLQPLLPRVQSAAFCARALTA